MRTCSRGEKTADKPALTLTLFSHWNFAIDFNKDQIQLITFLLKYNFLPYFYCAPWCALHCVNGGVIIQKITKAAK